MRSLPAALLFLAACAGLRETYREASNEELEGRSAPSLEGGVWIGGGKERFESARWKVVAFFKPT